MMNRSNPEVVPEGPVELENQFVLRLPSEPAKALKEIIRSGAMNLKDRLSIKIEPDMRYGEVRLDHWLLHAKLMDLPCIIESLKTIDNKSFYKTADICQILICTEEEEPNIPEEEQPKQRKKDPNKVDKKYLWPHGLAPPLKNVRRRRFRKTLKKKFVEAPEIEKEVKRLLRVDNEAVTVKWDVLSEDAAAGSGIEESASLIGIEEEGPDGNIIKTEDRTKVSHQGAVVPPEIADSSLLDSVAEHDIFGEAVSDLDVDDEYSDYDDEDGGQRIDVLTLEDEESSRLMLSAGEDSRISADNSSPPCVVNKPELITSTLVTQFSRDMFETTKAEPSSPVHQSQFQYVKPGSSSMERQERMLVLEKELEELWAKREQQEQKEMAGDIENVALKQRFSEMLEMLDGMIAAKREELKQLYDELP